MAGGRILCFATCAAVAVVLVQRVRARRRARREARRQSADNAQVRIWMDGVFDLAHFGHANAFRQARSRGTYLVVGINDDESTTRCKGAPLMSEDERAAAVAGCRWVDQVVCNVPYVMDDEYVAKMLEEHRIDYIVHGDDPCIVDGRDVYEVAKKLGKYRNISYTEGISTTEIVRRVLAAGAPATDPRLEPHEPPSAHSHFLLTTRMLAEASPLSRGRGSVPRCIVYIDGGFDLFHAGHVAVLRAARALGDYLIVGLHDDATVKRLCGPETPILALNERVMGVLGCRHVDDVLISPPWHISREMIASLGIAVVVRARVDDELPALERSVADRYETARTLDIFAEVPVDEFPDLRTSNIIRRVVERKSQLSTRVSRKQESERAYYKARYGLELPQNGLRAVGSVESTLTA